MNLLQKALVAYDRTINFLAFLAGSLLVLLMLIICYEVLMRYFFRVPSGWIVEICEYMLLYITFFGTAWLLKEDRHIRVDVVFALFNPRFQKVLGLVTSAMGAISCSFIVVFGALNTWKHIQEGTLVIQTLNTPKWVLVAVIPLGSFLLVIQFLRYFFGLLDRAGGSDEMESEREEEV